MKADKDIDKLIYNTIRKELDNAIIKVIPQMRESYRKLYLQLVAQFYEYKPKRYKRHPVEGGNFQRAFQFNYTNTASEFSTPDDISGFINASAILPHTSVTNSDNYSEEGIILFALHQGRHSNFPWLVKTDDDRPPWTAQLQLPEIGSVSNTAPSIAWEIMSEKIMRYYEGVVQDELAISVFNVLVSEGII